MIIWSPDGQNWGNPEYYATNGHGGWSKDIVNEGVITETELLNNNCAVFEGTNPYTSTVCIFRKGATIVPNGDIAYLLARGTWDNVGAGKDITHLRMSIYSIDNQSWTHNEITVGSAGDDIPGILTDANQGGKLITAGQDSVTFDFITRIQDTNKELWRYRTKDAGKSWTKVEEITSGSGYDWNILNKSEDLFDWGGEVILADNNSNSDVLFIKFDKYLKKDEIVLPSYSSAPSDLPVGSLIYRTDLD